MAATIAHIYIWNFRPAKYFQEKFGFSPEEAKEATTTKFMNPFHVKIAGIKTEQEVKELFTKAFQIAYPTWRVTKVKVVIEMNEEVA